MVSSFFTLITALELIRRHFNFGFLEFLFRFSKKTSNVIHLKKSWNMFPLQISSFKSHQGLSENLIGITFVR